MSFASALLPLGYAAAGSALERGLRGRDAKPYGPLQRAAWSALGALGLWTAVNWLLALTHLLVPAGLAVGGLVAAGVGLWALRGWNWREPLRLEGSRLLRGCVALLLLGLGLFGVFVLWRGRLMPVSGNDALSYHLPRAVLLAREHGYRLFQATDTRVSTWPANFELLLADVLLLDGNDRHVTWLGALSYMAFLLASGAVAERWGAGVARSGWTTLAVVTVAAAAPVALLHAGAVKNDLLANFFFLMAFLGAGELAVQPTAPRAGWTGAALLLALGTKLNAAMLVAALLPLLAIAVARAGRPRLRVWGGGALLGIVGVVVLGGGVYLWNLLKLGRPVGIPAVSTGGYGDWQNLWMLPVLLFKAPLSSTSDAVWAPWTHSFWFWQKYDVYSSHLGAAFTGLLVLAPFGAFAVARRRTERSRECLLAACAALVAFFLILPTHLVPTGFFCTFTRFLVFIVPVVSFLALSPWLSALPTGGRGETLAAVLAGGLLCTLFVEAWGSIQHDMLQPLSRVETCASGESCGVRFARGRACFALQHLAKPKESVVIDSDFDAWVYPCFGGVSGRPVGLVAPRDVADIPDSADWVVIDRMYAITWGHPGLRDFGHFFELVGKGAPTEEDVRLYRQLSRDPRFELAFDHRPQNQAVFRRRRSPPLLQRAGSGAPAVPLK